MVDYVSTWTQKATILIRESAYPKQGLRFRKSANGCLQKQVLSHNVAGKKGKHEEKDPVPL